MTRIIRFGGRGTPIAIWFAIAVAYWAAAQLGFSLAFSVRQVSPVWPPAGLAVAALLRFGLRGWPGVAAGAFAANVGAGAPVATALSIAAGNTLEAVCTIALLRLLAFRTGLDRLHDVLALVAAILPSTALAATIGVTSLARAGLLPAEGVVEAWIVWWVGDAVGALVVAPVLLGGPRVARPARRRLESLGFVTSLLAIGLVVFGVMPVGPVTSQLGYLVFPLLIWAALRFGTREVATIVAGVAVLAIAGSLQDRGPFGAGDLTTRLVLLQLFVGVFGVTALALAALVSERQVAEAERDRLLGQERAARAEVEAAYRAVQEANAAKDEFLAVLSHELRTPLTPILGWARLLRESDVDDATRTRALEVIERNARVQVRLVEDILDVSRIVAGKMTFERQLVDLGQVAAASCEAVRRDAEAKSLRFDLRLPPSAALVWGDAQRLQQAIVNVLSNAVKFTPAGGSIALSIDDEGQDFVVRVTDDGAGIDPRFLPHMFAAFTQADTGTTRAHSGLGLGLWIARHVVAHHQGSVSATSDGPERGTTITLRLPRAEAALPASVLPPAAAPEAAGRLAGRRVLVVDDEADARELLRVVLGGAGAEVRVESDMAGALDACDTWRPDVLISDLAMPGHDGLDLIRALRLRGSRVAAVLLTAHVGTEERRRAIEAGYDAHVAKPVDHRSLIAALVDLVVSRPPAP